MTSMLAFATNHGKRKQELGFFNNAARPTSRLIHFSRKMTPRPLILCGPSGVGKSTLLKRLLGEFGEYFGFSVSHTTRGPRPGEEHGTHYFFISRDDMNDAIHNGDFIEHAEYSGNLYGTSKKAVQEVLGSGRMCILDIDAQGVQQVKQSDLKPLCVFVKPPSVQVLEKRLRDRGTETEESLAKRLNIARIELEFGDTPGNFDVIIVNDDVDRAYEQLKVFVLPAVQAIQEK